MFTAFHVIATPVEMYLREYIIAYKWTTRNIWSVLEKPNAQNHWKTVHETLKYNLRIIDI